MKLVLQLQTGIVSSDDLYAYLSSDKENEQRFIDDVQDKSV